eukprot:8813461-Ditylum_brightwellii.AAC.1
MVAMPQKKTQKKKQLKPKSYFYFRQQQKSRLLGCGDFYMPSRDKNLYALVSPPFEQGIITIRCFSEGILSLNATIVT